MNNVKFDSKKQKTIKGLSKAIYIISKIGRIMVTVAIPFILLTFILLTFYIYKTDLKDDTLSVDGEAIGAIKLVETEEQGASLIITGEEIENKEIKLSDFDKDIVLKVKEAINGISKSTVMSLMIIGTIAFTAFLIIVRSYLKHFEILFKNINKEDSPFTLENVGHIKKIAYLLIATIVIPMVFSLIASLMLKTDFNLKINTVNIMEILIIFAMAYIFEYGYEIQKDSQGKIYGEIAEESVKKE